MERIPELCTYYISLIRSVALVLQNSHWLTKGNDFYGDHLLYERIYDAVSADADKAAERFVGLWGTEVLDLHMQAQIIGKTLEDFVGDDPLEMSLKAQQKFLEFADKFYKILEKNGKLTLGLQDLLPEISSNRESDCYLLKQAMDENVVSADNEYVDFKMAARKKFLKRVR